MINLTFLNQTIWFDIDWEDIKPLVVKYKQRNKKILDLWCSELGQKDIHRQNEYNKYFEYFFCDDPKDYEIIISNTISYFKEKGLRELDLRLYNRVGCLDFAETKKLLK